MERIKTGIPGLDELIEGGFPPKSTILVAGTCGSGKTIFCSQFLYVGATQYGENGVYVSLEESAESIKNNASRFGFDLGKLENEGKLRFVSYEPKFRDITEIMREITSSVSEVNAKRVCVDSLAGLGLYLETLYGIRRSIADLTMMLKNLGCTSILTTEIPPGSQGLSRFNVEEFVVDGVIVLNYVKRERIFERSVVIWKLRGSNHSRKVHPFEITERGIVVFPKEEVM